MHIAQHTYYSLYMRDMNQKYKYSKSKTIYSKPAPI